MTATELTYLVFGIIIIIAVIFDLGLLSRRNHTITIKQASVLFSIYKNNLEAKKNISLDNQPPL